MSHLRAAIRLILFLVITLFYYCVILFGVILSIFGADRKAWASYARFKWGALTAKIIGMKIKVSGTPPSPPFFLVCNHLSYADIWVLFANSKGTFIAKSDIKDWPIAGFVLGTSGLIFVDRGRRSDVSRVNKEISEHLTETQGIFLFPESTTSGGEGLLPFKSSLFQYPASEGIEVSSAAITYSCDDPSIDVSTDICWWTDIPFPKHFWNLFRIKSFEATITFSDQKLVHSDRKYLASSTESIIKQIFEPVKQSHTYAESASSTAL